jgi:predicted negative regulator of RcsB-dependent stress response
MNITNYPNSFNVYDSMGDYYDAKGDKQKAIQSYTKALSLKDWPDTRKKLEKLKAGK